MTDSQTMYGGKGAISVAECCVVVDSVDRKSILSITRAVQLLLLTSGELRYSIQYYSREPPLDPKTKATQIFIKYMHDIVLQISFLDINSQNGLPAQKNAPSQKNCFSKKSVFTCPSTTSRNI